MVRGKSNVGAYVGLLFDSCGQFSLTYSNATENSVHIWHLMIISKVKVVIHDITFVFRARTGISFTWPLSCSKYLPSVLLNIMMICVNVHRSSLTKNVMIFLSRFERKRQPVSISANISAPFTKGLVFIKQLKPLLTVLFTVGETEGDRFPTPASKQERDSFHLEISFIWPQKD